MAYINVTSKTDTTIKARVADLDTSYSRDDRVCSWYIDGEYMGENYLDAYASAGDTFTFSGLDPFTEYEVEVEITADGWANPVALSTYVTTEKATASISVTETTTSSISVRLINMSTTYTKDDRVCRWYIDGSYSGQIDLEPRATTSSVYTFYGLAPNTTYDILANVVADTWESDFEATATTKKLSASINVTDKTDTTISVRLINMDTSYSSDNRTCSWYVDGTYVDQISLAAYASQSSIYTITGLEPSTEYEIEAIVSTSTWSSSFKTSVTTEEAPPISISLWSWTSSNGSATSSQTKSAYTAITGNGAVSDFSYLVWNDLVDKIYEVIEAKNSSWSANYTTRNAAKMSSSDKTLTAMRFNSVRYNLDRFNSTGIGTVDTGDVVYGHYFTTITDALNECIEDTNG